MNGEIKREKRWRIIFMVMSIIHLPLTGLWWENNTEDILLLLAGSICWVGVVLTSVKIRKLNKENNNERF